MSKRKVTAYFCDNPRCDEVRYEHFDEAAFGYHLGKGVVISTMGGQPIPATYACSVECIGPAVEEMIRVADEEGS